MESAAQMNSPSDVAKSNSCQTFFNKQESFEIRTLFSSMQKIPAAWMKYLTSSFV